jgi:hypothetical protein
VTSPHSRHTAPFRPVRSSCSWKAGIVFGGSTTVYQEIFARRGSPARPDCRVLPTLVAYPKKGTFCDGRGVRVEIGDAAESRRDQYDAVAPLSIRPPRRAVAILDFVEGLRRETQALRLGRPWGVVACPSGADAEKMGELRHMGAELFERLLVVDEALLATVGILQDPVGRHAMVVDLGKTSVRASLVSGRAPGADERFEMAGGGDAVDARLKALLLERYPDLALTDLTIARLKESLGFVAPARRTAVVELVLGGSRRRLDITEIVGRACEGLVDDAVEAIRQAIARCPSDGVEAFLGSIFLMGGGAEMPGMPQRIQAELEAEGLEDAVVHSVANPRTISALGALKWALVTPDEAWEVPLFQYRPAV